MRFIWFLSFLFLIFIISACASTKETEASNNDKKNYQEKDIYTILEKNPFNKDANIALSKKLIKEQNFEKALDQSQNLIVKDSENYLGYYLAGITYMEKNDITSAISSLQRAENEILTDKTDEIILNDIRKRLALLFYESDNLNDSETYFSLCWDYIHKDENLYYKRGFVQLKTAKKEEGLTNIRISADMGYSEAITLLNAVIRDHKEKVLLFYSQCLNDNKDGCMNLFKTLSLDENLNKESGVDNIDKIEALTQAASLGDVNAEKIFKKDVISKCDDSFSVKNCFPSAVYYFKTKNLDKAVSYMKKIVDSKPENPFWHYSLALFYAHLEKYELSAKELEISIKIDSTYNETALKEPVLERTIKIIRSEY